DWTTIFIINIPIGLLTLVLGGLGITESADPDKAALDPVGQLLSIVALGGITYGLIEAGALGWDSPWTLGSLALGAVALLGFVAVELKVARPLLPLYLFKKNLDFFQYNMASFALGFATYS